MCAPLLSVPDERAASRQAVTIELFAPGAGDGVGRRCDNERHSSAARGNAKATSHKLDLFGPGAVGTDPARPSAIPRQHNAIYAQRESPAAGPGPGLRCHTIPVARLLA